MVLCWARPQAQSFISVICLITLFHVFFIFFKKTISLKKKFKKKQQIKENRIGILEEKTLECSFIAMAQNLNSISSLQRYKVKEANALQWSPHRGEFFANSSIASMMWPLRISIALLISEPIIYLVNGTGMKRKSRWQWNSDKIRVASTQVK